MILLLSHSLGIVTRTEQDLIALSAILHCRPFLSLIISFLVQLQHLLLPSLIVTSSQVKVGTPLPLLSCCISGHCFAMVFVHLVRPTSWKHWPIRLNSVGPPSFWVSKSWVKNFDLKLGSVNARKYSASNQAWSGATWPVISLAPFLKEILIRSGCFKPSSIRLSGMPLASKDIQQVYQLNWGVFCALIRSDIVTILACLDLSHTWILVAYLLDRAGISPQQRTDMPAKGYYNSDGRSSNERIGR